MKTHAFLITAHDFPEQLKDIVSLLDSSNHLFFINIDRKNKKMLSTDAILRLKTKENVIFLPPMRVNHGGFSQVACTLRLLEEAYNWKRIKIDYFHLISGQDYPCISNSDIDAIFESENKSYMYYDPPEKIIEFRKQKFPKRIDYFNFFGLYIPFLPNILLKQLIRFLNRIAKIYKRRPLTDIYSGLNWFSWHRSVVEYVLKYVNDNLKYVRRFRLSHCSDEIFFHTILFHQADLLNIEKYNSLRFVEWRPKRKTETLPLVLDEREYVEIINSGVIFCRKVHPVHSAKLIALLKRDLKMVRQEN